MSHKVSIQRLRAEIKLVESLISNDFPYKYIREALHQIERLLRERLTFLEKINPVLVNKDVIETLGEESLTLIVHTLRYIGFLLRSSDVRNSFELYNPLSLLVSKLIYTEDGKTPKLILSSEWDYSPFTYIHPKILGMDDYVFIGLPASETGNALIAPLAGHEIGHNIWRTHKLENEFEGKLFDRICEIISNDYWDKYSSQSDVLSTRDDLKGVLWFSVIQFKTRLAIAQLEELFCDFVGIYYFNKSFLSSYSYLLSPAIPGIRSARYPSNSDRVKAHMYACDKFGIEAPPDYESHFNDINNPAGMDLDLEIIGKACFSFLDDILKLVKDYYVNASLNEYSMDRVKIILENFKLGVPCKEKESLTNIINAAWVFYDSDFQYWKDKYLDLWNDYDNREKVLSDLVFKSLEVAYILENYK